MNGHTIKNITIVFAVLSCGIIEPAVADGNEMIRGCKEVIRLADGPDVAVAGVSVDAGFCLGFVQGVNQVLSILSATGQCRTNMCLLEKGVKALQAAKIFVKFLDDHPERLHEPEILLYIIAVGEAFPCE